MNYDITFCSRANCKDKECKRNLNNVPEEDRERFIDIWQSDFKECEHWKE